MARAMLIRQLHSPLKRSLSTSIAHWKQPHLVPFLRNNNPFLVEGLSPLSSNIFRASSSNSPNYLQCWSCGINVDAGKFFCRCGKIQPLNDNWSYFDVLGYDGPTIRIDTEDLSMRMHRIQKLLHPDKFSRASKYEQRLAGEAATFVNNAYSTLRRPVDRFAYVLSFYGFEEETEPKNMSSDFLSEIMDLNEDIHTITEILEEDTSDEDTSLRELVHSVVQRISHGLLENRRNVVQLLESSKFRDSHASLVRYRYFLRARDQLREWDSVLNSKGIHLNLPPE